MKALARALLVLAALSVLAAAWLWQANFNDGVDIDGPAAATAARLATPAQQARGAYLAQVGNCLACHTARGGAPGAGGLAIATGFGTAFSSNLTPDPAHGIGQWSAAVDQATAAAPGAALPSDAQVIGAVQRATGVRPGLPPHMADLFARPERMTRVPNDLGALQALVRERIARR